MNNYKTQHKQTLTDAELQKHKNFDEVLRKQSIIKASYNKVWKFTLGLSILTVIACAYFFYPNASTKADNMKTTSAVIIKKTAGAQPSLSTLSHQNSKQNLTTTKKVKIVNTTKTNTHVAVKKDAIATDKYQHKQPSEQLKPLHAQDSTVDQSHNTTNLVSENKWLRVNELAIDERVKLPTLFISKKSWPDVLTKSLLVKNPTIFAVYENINREAPVVGGVIYVSNPSNRDKPKIYKIINNNFPAGLIRAIHSANDDAVLIIKNLQLYIPGKGRVSLGDKKINIVKDEDYRKNIEQGAGRGL